MRIHISVLLTTVYLKYDAIALRWFRKIYQNNKLSIHTIQMPSTVIT